MKKLTMLCKGIIMLSIALISVQCSKTNDEISKPMLSTSEAKTKALDFLQLSGDTYNLNLTLEDARKMGISEVDYFLMQKEVAKTNSAIKDMQSTGKEVILTNPKEHQMPTTKGPHIFWDDDDYDLYSSGSRTDPFKVDVRAESQGKYTISAKVPYYVDYIHYIFYVCGLIDFVNLEVVIAGQTYIANEISYFGWSRDNGSFRLHTYGYERYGRFSISVSNINGGKVCYKAL